MVNNTFANAFKKNIIVTGHYGSGKTNVAVNLALALKGTGADVTLVDLDTVNPYFRAADSRKLLVSQGVKCIIPDYANTNVDIPSLPAEINSVFDYVPRSDGVPSYSVFDVGGDNGAVALGTYSARFAHHGYDMLYVINKYRPLTETPAEALGIMREIEHYSRLRHTAVINNSNIGEITTSEDIAGSYGYARAVCELSGLPLAFTSYMDIPGVISPDNLDVNGAPLFALRYVTKRLF